MADGTKVSGDEYMNQNQPENTTTEETQETVEEPIENKWNDLQKYWDYEDDEKRMSSDTPIVRIYLSRERLPDDVETKEISLEEALAKEGIEAGTDQDITEENTSVVSVDGEQQLAMNAIDKLQQSNFWK